MGIRDPQTIQGSDFVFRLIAKTNSEWPGFVAQARELCSPMYIDVNDIVDVAADMATHAFVCVSGSGHLIGFYMIALNFPSSIPDSIFLGLSAVALEARGKGVASTLYGMLGDELNKKGGLVSERSLLWFTTASYKSFKAVCRIYPWIKPNIDGVADWTDLQRSWLALMADAMHGHYDPRRPEIILGGSDARYSSRERQYIERDPCARAWLDRWGIDETRGDRLIGLASLSGPRGE